MVVVLAVLTVPRYPRPYGHRLIDNIAGATYSLLVSICQTLVCI
jgi:hypothetical protein